MIFAKLFSHVLGNGLLVDIQANVKAKMEQRITGNPDGAQRLRLKAQKLDGRADQLLGKWSRAPRQGVRAANHGRTATDQQPAAKAHRRGREAPAVPRAEAEAKKVAGRLMGLSSAAQDWSTKQRRRWLQRVVRRVDVRFGRRRVAQRFRHEILGGTIEFDMVKMIRCARSCV